LWHVHGHRNECFARYSPGFIQGAGRVEGEICHIPYCASQLRLSGAHSRPSP
ncbi:hypothetical protein PAXRUDRAFT_77389, partial [Paxillus rubicundulus Ve08.2h10]